MFEEIISVSRLSTNVTSILIVQMGVSIDVEIPLYLYTITSVVYLYQL